MTAPPLAFDFALATPAIDRAGGPLLLSIRPLWSIDRAEQLAELGREIGYRATAYPRMVDTGRLKQADADRHVRILESVLLDLDDVADRPRATGTWPAMIRELRRELALRRNLWPKLIDSGRMKPADACRHMEALEAAHWACWIELRGIDSEFPAGTPAAQSSAIIHGLFAQREIWLERAAAEGHPIAAAYLTARGRPVEIDPNADVLRRCEIARLEALRPDLTAAEPWLRADPFRQDVAA